MFGPEFRRKKTFHFCATVGGSLVTEKLLAKKTEEYTASWCSLK